MIHWVSEPHAVKAEVRLYNRLFSHPNPDTLDNFLDGINPDSLEVIESAYVEASLAQATTNDRYQFERVGYFYLDSVDSTPEKPVFNRTVTLRDSWGK